ncbi:hypothetical protein ANN_13648 [Periplaneta americana]|uniref:Uncharacterized protein n=1 Tax=Periplaneta americana TaxID=6978 RepID=A0ABQ8TLF5_PERAM|nr:hypothetical protein ANN_13648 [Periplaneta americana]
MYTDLYFAIGTDSGVKLHSKAGATVYYYYFDYRGENSYSSIFGDPTEDYGELENRKFEVKHVPSSLSQGTYKLNLQESFS